MLQSLSPYLQGIWLQLSSIVPKLHVLWLWEEGGGGRRAVGRAREEVKKKKYWENEEEERRKMNHEGPGSWIYLPCTIEQNLKGYKWL